LPSRAGPAAEGGTLRCQQPDPVVEVHKVAGPRESGSGIPELEKGTVLNGKQRQRGLRVHRRKVKAARPCVGEVCACPCLVKVGVLQLQLPRGAVASKYQRASERDGVPLSRPGVTKARGREGRGVVLPRASSELAAGQG
jgi:hypothetical protein